MGDVGNSRILINTCRRKIENPDEANILVIIVSENIHQWVLISGPEFAEKHDMHTISKDLTQDY